MLKAVFVNIARLVVGLTFVFSGFVKAVDPLGTVYKLNDYAAAVGMAGAVPEWMLTVASVALSLAEFTLGIAVLFAVRRRLTARLTVGFILVMTLLTVWVYVANPVSDCGCFGDAVKLTNGQTLLKNIVLLLLAIVLLLWHDRMPRLISHENRSIVLNYSALFLIGVALYALYNLPLFDFRPYHVGADIRKGMEIPEGAEQPVYNTMFIMEKDGKRQEFTLDDYPDSTWTFVDSKTELVKAGYEPPIHDFMIERISDGEDLTDSILSASGYTFLLISPHLDRADDTNFGLIDEVYEYAQDNGYGFFCLTASTEKAIARWADITGAEYPFCLTDETTLKTIIRSNPGLLLLHGSKVVGKWSHNNIPADEITQGGKITERSSFLPQEDVVAKKIGLIMMWYVLPLLLLIVADRTLNIFKFFKHKKHYNGKENRSRQLENEQEPAGGHSPRQGVDGGSKES